MTLLFGTFAVLVCSLVQTTVGHGRFRGYIPNGDAVPNPCGGIWEAVGHMSPSYVQQKNDFGMDFSRGGHTWNQRVCQMDSDGDGLTNGQELGDPECRWRRNMSPSGRAIGHPGICERGRATCKRNHRASCGGGGGGSGGGAGMPRRGPGATANDHPQAFLTKQMAAGQSGSSGSVFMGGAPSAPGAGMGSTRFSTGGAATPQFPNFQTFRANLDQVNLQRSGIFPRAGMPTGASFGMPSMQDQVQRRMQQERMRMPGSGGMMWTMGGGGSGGIPFGASGMGGMGASGMGGMGASGMGGMGASRMGGMGGGTFAPMSPMGSAMGGGGGSFMMPSQMGYPPF